MFNQEVNLFRIKLSNALNGPNKYNESTEERLNMALDKLANGDGNKLK